jgi:hypothetical protein
MCGAVGVCTLGQTNPGCRPHAGVRHTTGAAHHSQCTLIAASGPQPCLSLARMVGPRGRHMDVAWQNRAAVACISRTPVQMSRATHPPTTHVADYSSVVVDFGCSTTKVGFAGTDAPVAWFPTVREDCNNAVGTWWSLGLRDTLAHRYGGEHLNRFRRRINVPSIPRSIVLRSSGSGE